MDATSAKTRFTDELGKALAHLYDPDYLRRSVLIELFDLTDREDATDALRRNLIAAIGRLKPDAAVPPNSHAWRFYHILYYRFVEQFTQREVAADLALSVRQLRRQEATAQAVLADYLWTHNDLYKRAARRGQPAAAAVAADEAAQLAGREAELARLARALPTEPAALCDIIGRVQETLQPLLRAAGVTVRCQVAEDLPPLAVQESAARQAFIHLTTIAARCAPGGRVRIKTIGPSTESHALVVIEALRAVVVNVQQVGETDLSLARRLVEVAGGALELRLDEAAPAPFMARLRLPVAGYFPVLVVDDNNDTLALLARYLSGTPYRFVGVADPKTAVSLAVETRPAAIILDVMLPGVDGWELLSQLREHPQLAAVPCLISTILPYGELADALGAAAFLPKPVSREALLAALDRLARRRPPGAP